MKKTFAIALLTALCCGSAMAQKRVVWQRQAGWGGGIELGTTSYAYALYRPDPRLQLEVGLGYDLPQEKVAAVASTRMYSSLHDFAYYGSLSAGLTAESFDLWCGYQMGLAFHGLEMGLGIQCYFDGLDYYDCQPNTTIRLQLAPSRKSLYRAGSPSFERSRGLFMRADLLIVLPGVSMGFQFDPHHQVSLGLLGFSEVAFVQAGYRYHLLTNKWSPYADARLMLHMYGELAGMVQVGLSYKDMDLGVGALIVRDDYELHALAPCLTAGYTLRPQTSEYRDHHSVGHPTYRGHFLLAE